MNIYPELEIGGVRFGGGELAEIITAARQETLTLSIVDRLLEKWAPAIRAAIGREVK